jgi:hypothetical protein
MAFFKKVTSEVPPGQFGERTDTRAHFAASRWRLHTFQTCPLLANHLFYSQNPNAQPWSTVLTSFPSPLILCPCFLFVPQLCSVICSKQYHYRHYWRERGDHGAEDMGIYSSKIQVGVYFAWQALADTSRHPDIIGRLVSSAQVFVHVPRHSTLATIPTARLAKPLSLAATFSPVHVAQP